MLIKSADDKTKRLALLEDLQKSTLLDTRQKDWLRDVRAGIAEFEKATFRQQVPVGASFAQDALPHGHYFKGRFF